MEWFFGYFLSHTVYTCYYTNDLLHRDRTMPEFKIIFFIHTLALDPSLRGQNNIHALLHFPCNHLKEHSLNLQSEPQNHGSHWHSDCGITHKTRFIVTTETPIGTSLTNQTLWHPWQAGYNSLGHSHQGNYTKHITVIDIGSCLSHSPLTGHNKAKGKRFKDDSVTTKT